MNRLLLRRLMAITILGFALTMISSTLEPAVLGHKVIELVPEGRNTALGFTTFAGLLVAILVQPLVGGLSDRTRSRWGRRLPYITGGAVLAIACLYGVALAPSFGLVVAVVLLMQLATSTMQSPWQALMPDQVPRDQRGRASGFQAVLDILAALVGRYVAGQIVGRFSEWGHSAILAAVSVPVVVLIVAFFVTARGAHEDSTRAEMSQKRALREAVTSTFAIDFRAHPAFAWWLANRFFFWCAFIALTTFLLFFAIDALGMTADEAQRTIGQVSVWLGVALLLMLIPASWLADRLGRKPLVVAAGALATLGTGILLVTHDLSLITIGAMIIGVGVGGYLTANWALVTDIVPRHETARYLGLANVATASGSALARLFGGMLIDSVNASTRSSSAGYLALFAVAATFFLISALAALFLPAPQLGSRPQPLNVSD